MAGYDLVVAHLLYHMACSLLERLIFKYIPDLTVLYTQFKGPGRSLLTGMQGISAESPEPGQALTVVTVHCTPRLRGIHRLRTTASRCSKDRAVRQALYLAIDKQAIIDQIY